jgi:hypothetical protein
MYVESGGTTFEHSVIPLGVSNDSPTWRVKLTGNHWEALIPSIIASPDAKNSSPQTLLDEEPLSDTDDVAAFVPFVPHEARGVRAKWGVDSLERSADVNSEDLSSTSNEDSDSDGDEVVTASNRADFTVWTVWRSSLDKVLDNM